jgi:hypothetical protein
MQVKNPQQAAAWKEIDTTRKHVKELEDSALKTISEIDGLQGRLDERKGGHDALKTRWDEAHAAWQHSGLRAEGKAEARLHSSKSMCPTRSSASSTASLSGGRASPWRPCWPTAVPAARIRPALQQQLKRESSTARTARILYGETRILKKFTAFVDGASRQPRPSITASSFAPTLK